MQLRITCLFLLFCSYSVAQTITPITGDWIRVKAEYADGSPLSRNHPATTYLRYNFKKPKCYTVVSNLFEEREYLHTGNTLRFGKFLDYVVEQSVDTSLILSEPRTSGAVTPIRYYFIPTKKFTASKKNTYPYTVTEADTIYTRNAGIEPIYTDGNFGGFNGYLLQKFSGVKAIAFEFTFVVLKDGSIGDVTISSSTDEKKNKKLIQVIKQTSGKWLSARIAEQAVNVRISERFNMGSEMR
jgi:hypothetical protein